MPGDELTTTCRTPSQPYIPEQVIHPKYRLVRRLGKGGYGEVWVGHDLVLDVQVALKLLFDDPADKDARARLLQEARAAARLSHPAIVRVHEFGETSGGTPFIAMELLAGATLADLASDCGRLAAAPAVQTLLPIADALSTAHANGIVHRDVKPDNIFLARDHLSRLFPKLLDFGIARLSLEQHITCDGMLLGTPAYMSPEQARGARDVDGRSDVWGFAAVLYELMTGRPPFEAENYNALLQAILTSEPAPITDFGAGDDDLWALIRKGLEKDRDSRWQSMRAFGTALASWLEARGISEDITGSSLRKSWFESEPPPPNERSSSSPLAQSELVTLRPETRPKRRRFFAAALLMFGALVLSTLVLLAHRDAAVAEPAELPTIVEPPARFEPVTLAPAARTVDEAAAAATKVPASPPAPKPRARAAAPKPQSKVDLGF